MDAFQRATAWVDTGAVTRNCERLRRELGDGTELCAVVKADGYGHGMAECARAAVAGGATRLAVATASEAFELRSALADTPILVMGALTDPELDVALGAGAELAVWREEFLQLVAERSAQFGRRTRVHVKYDSGMGRLGEREPANVERLLARADADGQLELAGLWTHFATADERGDDYFPLQLERFSELAERARERHDLTLHAANSAATLREPASHFDMVRCGVAVYGLDPFGEDPASHELEPVMGLSSYVADVKRFAEGDSAGYGRRWRATEETFVGVVPIGYGDGYRRGLGPEFEVLIAGRRYPLVGTVSMDNVTVDLGPEPEVTRGEEVVLLGPSGDLRITAERWAERLGTINYEVTCGISPRVPRLGRR
ncbi:MAG TPA: alanine racemase [Solirubrobacterales bacterium]|nr:alanine racemase [Solirubrobacterales bacterium]